MKLSTRSTYGVRAMLALALHQRPTPFMVKEIAEQYDLPATYLEQLMTLLRKAGLVTAVRGAHGGYILARPAVEITLAEIIEVLEGPLRLADCPAGAACCGHPDTCALADVWEDARRALTNSFQQVTLAQLAERHANKQADAALNYAI